MAAEFDPQNAQNLMEVSSHRSAPEVRELRDEPCARLRSSEFFCVMKNLRELNITRWNEGSQ
jgi:hypothetical protein